MIVVVVLVGIAILGIGAYPFMSASQKPESMMKQETTMVPSGAMMKKDGDAMMVKESDMETSEKMMKKEDTAMETGAMMEKTASTSRYVTYDKAAFEQAAGTRRVLFFYASWCPTCIPADESFSKNVSQLPEDVTLIRVNYNDPDTDQEEKDLAKAYGVTYQHTFVQIDGSGKEVAKWNGGKIDELLTNIK